MTPRIEQIRGWVLDGIQLNEKEAGELINALDVAEDALKAIKAHHTQLNITRGRAPERSKTIALANKGLGLS